MNMRVAWKKLGRDLGVIVLGVLIALGFESLAGRISEQRLEQSYLLRLSRDMRADSILLARYRQNADVGMEGGRQLLTILDSPNSRPADSLVSRYFGDATRGALISANTPTYEELTSTGNLRVIREAKVRDALLTYYSEVGRLQRTLETVMGRGREPLAEVGWDIGAFDGALTYAITRNDLAVSTPTAVPQWSGELGSRYRQHPDAERATRRAITYQGFLSPIIADWEVQLGTVRRVLPTRLE
jgi:hypothetical protein